MKKLFMLVTLIALAAAAFSGCEGPAGEDGIDGAAGAPGDSGLAGLDGVDANETCKVCHNSSDLITSRVTDYNASGHGTGTTYARGSSGSCAVCHSGQGFIQLASGETVTGPASPTRQDCRTCHSIHTAYDSTDWAPRVGAGDDVIMIVSDAAATPFATDFGAGNLCATCHQARYRDDLPAPDAVATTLVSITSSHWGPHHGPQSNMIDGTAGWQPTSATIDKTHPHQNVTNSCVTCHMYEGAHTFEPNEDACETCHAGEDMDDKIDATKLVLDAKIATLQAALLTLEYVDSTGHLHTAGTVDIPETHKGAIYNYILVSQEDAGYAVHNPDLAGSLLDASITAVE